MRDMEAWWYVEEGTAEGEDLIPGRLCITREDARELARKYRAGWGGVWRVVRVEVRRVP